MGRFKGFVIVICEDIKVKDIYVIFKLKVWGNFSKIE